MKEKYMNYDQETLNSMTKPLIVDLKIYAGVVLFIACVLMLAA